MYKLLEEQLSSVVDHAASHVLAVHEQKLGPTDRPAIATMVGMETSSHELLLLLVDFWRESGDVWSRAAAVRASHPLFGQAIEHYHKSQKMLHHLPPASASSSDPPPSSTSTPQALLTRALSDRREWWAHSMTRLELLFSLHALYPFAQEVQEPTQHQRKRKSPQKKACPLLLLLPLPLSPSLPPSLAP